jgi:Skp family chaperone for outer membrane proteins
MKHILFILSILAVLGFSNREIQAQSVKIAVVDMQRALADFHRTKVEVETINQLGEEEIRNIDERKAAYAKLTSEMVGLDKTLRATELSEAKRKVAGIKLQELAEARSLKANEIGDAERVASQKLFQARQKMEASLLGEIRAKVVEIVTAKGFDMVFDKSFLPKASKAILYTSPQVTDLTDEVIAKLNTGVPAGN